MLRNRKGVRWGVVACVILTFGPYAGAALILPGQAILAPPEADPIGGVILAGGAPVAFSSLTFSGTLTASVIQGDTTNPFGLSALTFTYLLQNDLASLNAIGRFTTNGFAGFSTDVSF